MPCFRCRASRIRIALWVVLAGMTAAPAARGQPVIPQPRVHGILPLGARAGTQVELRFIGDNLDGPPQEVFFSHPGIVAAPVMTTPDRFYPQARAVENRFVVKIGADVPAGVHEVRLANRKGITVARSFAVGDLPEISEVEPNEPPAKATEIALDTVVNGICDGRGVDVFRFRATKGQHLLIRSDAQRLDARGDVVLTLRDAAGNMLGRAHDSVRLDPLLDFTPPADGEYFLTVNDFLFRGHDLYPYRLIVSTGPWIDFIDPPVATMGTSSQHTIYGRNLPGGTPAEGVTGADAKPLEKLAVTIAAPAADEAHANPSIDTMLAATHAALPTMSYRLPSPKGVSNPVRLTLMQGAPTARENEPNDAVDAAQPITLPGVSLVERPAQVVATFGKKSDRDWYSFTAKRNEQFWIEVTSRRLGLATDPVIFVQVARKDAAGKTVFQDVLNTDDQARTWDNIADPRRKIIGDDPAVLFTAPEDASYRVLVQDLCGGTQGGPDLFYLLTVRPPQPDFSLVALAPMPDITVDVNYPGGALVRRGGTIPLEVIAFRREGFAGEIELSAESLPKGVTAAPALVPKWDDSGTIILQCAADAPPVLMTSIRITGRAKLPGSEQVVVRQAQSLETVGRPEDTNPKPPPRAVRQFVLGVRDDVPASCVIQPGTPGQTLRMPRGAIVKLPIRITRTGEAKNDLQINPIGTPPNMARSPVLVRANESDAFFEIDANPIVPAGRFAMWFRESAVIKWQHNPAANKLARDDRDRIAAIQKSDDELLAKAQQVRQEAEKALAAAQNETLLAAASSTLEERRKGEEAATKAKNESDLARQQVDLRVGATGGFEQFYDFKLLVASAPAMIEIVETPFTLTYPPITLKAGAAEPVALPVTIKKEFGWDEEIRFLLMPPEGVTGVTLLTGDRSDFFAKGAGEAKPKFRADATAQPGARQFKLRTLYRVNGRDMHADLPLDITVQPADSPRKRS